MTPEDSSQGFLDAGSILKVFTQQISSKYALISLNYPIFKCTFDLSTSLVHVLLDCIKLKKIPLNAWSLHSWRFFSSQGPTWRSFCVSWHWRDTWDSKRWHKSPLYYSDQLSGCHIGNCYEGTPANILFIFPCIF